MSDVQWLLYYWTEITGAADATAPDAATKLAPTQQRSRRVAAVWDRFSEWIDALERSVRVESRAEKQQQKMCVRWVVVEGKAGKKERYCRKPDTAKVAVVLLKDTAIVMKRRERECRWTEEGKEEGCGSIQRRWRQWTVALPANVLTKFWQKQRKCVRYQVFLSIGRRQSLSEENQNLSR